VRSLRASRCQARGGSFKTDGSVTAHADGHEGKDVWRRHALDAALAIIADRGLAALLIRNLAQEIGKSATVIVNQFQSKEGLLCAVAEAATAADEAYHRRFLAEPSRPRRRYVIARTTQSSPSPERGRTEPARVIVPADIDVKAMRGRLGPGSSPGSTVSVQLRFAIGNNAAAGRRPVHPCCLL